MRLIRTDIWLFADPRAASYTGPSTPRPSSIVTRLGRVEVLAAVILAPGLKVFAGGGLNLPSAAAFSVGAVYLIGAR
jgi:hypothetical protein